MQSLRALEETGRTGYPLFTARSRATACTSRPIEVIPESHVHVPYDPDRGSRTVLRSVRRAWLCGSTVMAWEHRPIGDRSEKASWSQRCLPSKWDG